MADQAFFEGRQTALIPPGHDVAPSTALRAIGMRMDCSPVGQIVVTPIIQDTNLGDYIREIRIFSLPVTGADPELLLSVRMHGLSIKQLEIVTPPSTF